MDDTPFWVAFHRIPAIGRARFDRLESYFGLLAEAWRAEAGDLTAAGLDAKAVAAITASRPKIDPVREMERLERAGITPLTWNHPRYPVRLRETYDRPPVLYVKGDLVPEDDWCVAVVGTREATPYGRQATEHLVRGLAEAGVTVISGLARGIDWTAHTTALKAGGRTIAVLPCPLDQVYPRGHRALAESIAAHGALLSDYALDTHMQRDSFWRRNRIVAGMTLGTVVVEAGEKSGALITARLALDENREVFAVPGTIFASGSRGPHDLIQQGAKLVQRVEDILTELDLIRAPRPEQLALLPAAPDDPHEAAIYGRLNAEPCHIDEIVRATALPVAVVSGALAMLELRGLARQMGAMLYIRA